MPRSASSPWQTLNICSLLKHETFFHSCRSQTVLWMTGPWSPISASRNWWPENCEHQGTKQAAISVGCLSDATQIGSAHTKIRPFQNLKYFLLWRHLPEHWRQELCCCQEVLLRYLLSLVSFCIIIMWKMNTMDLIFIFSQKKKKKNSSGKKNKSHSRNQANSCTCLSTLTTEGNSPPPSHAPW